MTCFKITGILSITEKKELHENYLYPAYNLKIINYMLYVNYI